MQQEWLGSDPGYVKTSRELLGMLQGAQINQVAILHDSNRPASRYCQAEQGTRGSRNTSKGSLLSGDPCPGLSPSQCCFYRFYNIVKFGVQAERPVTTSSTAQCTKCTNLWHGFADYENSAMRLDVHQSILSANTITCNCLNMLMATHFLDDYIDTKGGMIINTHT